MALDTLYKQVVLSHYKNPHNYGGIPDDWACVEEENPSCGDQFKVGVNIENSMITEIRFEGRGCAVSTAACSLLTEYLKGKTTQEAKKLIEQYLDAMKGKGTELILRNHTWDAIATNLVVKIQDLTETV